MILLCVVNGRKELTMSDYHLFSLVVRKARKEHDCIWCSEAIPKGTAYKHEQSIYDGSFQNQHWHPECLDASREYMRKYHENDFTPWENDRPKVDNSNNRCNTKDTVT